MLSLITIPLQDLLTLLMMTFLIGLACQSSVSGLALGALRSIATLLFGIRAGDTQSKSPDQVSQSK